MSANMWFLKCIYKIVNMHIMAFCAPEEISMVVIRIRLVVGSVILPHAYLHTK